MKFQTKHESQRDSIHQPNRHFYNPNGIASCSPGLRGTSYPGLRAQRFATPKGLHHLAKSPLQPRWGCGARERFPRVARASQPWADGWNPVGIQLRNSRKALTLTQGWPPLRANPGRNDPILLGLWAGLTHAKFKAQTPSPRQSGERAGVRGVDLKIIQLSWRHHWPPRPGPLLPRGRRGRKPQFRGTFIGMRLSWDGGEQSGRRTGRLEI